MEVFLPDGEQVLRNEWGRAKKANETLIEHVCTSEVPRPYLIMNANVVLVDSRNRKFRERGRC